MSSAGIGSGLDVESIVTKLMAIERQPVANLQTRASTIQTEISAFGSLQSSVAGFRDAAQALTNSSTWGATTATSSDNGSVGVSTGSGAHAGSYSVSVQNLASAQSVASQSYASSSAVIGEGGLTIDVGAWDVGQPGFAARATINAMSIPISATDTLRDVRDKINAANAGVTASIVTDSSGARLVLTSSATGVNNGFSVTGTGGAAALTYDASDGSSPMTRTQTASDAQATVNGLAITSASNTLTDVVQGLTLNLSKVTTGSVQLNVVQDNDSIKKSIQTFVKAYNSLASQLATLTKYDAATKTAGTLQGDSTAVGLQRQMRSLLTNATSASSAFSSLSDVGIEIQSTGQLTVNDTKLSSALGNLPELKKLFANNPASTIDTSQIGIAQRLSDFGDQEIGTDGALTTRTSGLNTSLANNQKNQDAINQRLTNTEARIRAQYTALDTQMASMSALSTYITQQVANWSRTSSSN